MNVCRPATRVLERCRFPFLTLVVFLLSTTSYAQKILLDRFDYELLFEVPEVEHPSVVTCDDRGNLFIGEDPMDMRGPSTEEFDRILYVVFDENGRPVRKTVFADHLSAVFGMIWHDGALYVMHAPHYTMFKDTDGDGVADVRKRLADGFGAAPGVYGFNDHIVSGIRLGMDGFVYVSVGDKGIPSATGSDGSTLTLEGGGVVRMRLDGSELEIFSYGTRNHLDVAMDSLDNIFTYDNTDDGLGWWTRFTHHIPTGYYGYPYDYHPHPERHLPHISEHGSGSPVGGACYRGARWPKKFWDADFHCEWGKRKIQIFYPKKKGATFTATMEDFMVPGPADEFRPQDNCFSPDGKYMYVADWQYAGWTNPAVRGRVFRISYNGELLPEPPRVSNEAPVPEQVRALGHPDRHERMRAQWELARRGRSVVEAVKKSLLSQKTPKLGKVHALWTLAEVSRQEEDYDCTADLAKAFQDSDPDVRAQALRALGTLRLKLGFATLREGLRDNDPTVRLYAAVGLGRLGQPEAATDLVAAMTEEDEFARFAMIQALRAIDNWKPALEAALAEDSTRTQAILVALTGEYDPGAVDALSVLARKHDSPLVRAEAVSALSEVHRKAAPYKGGWWGTRPAAGKPSREKNRDWEGTEKVLSTIHGALEDASAEVRIASLKALERVGEGADTERLRQLLLTDPSSEVRIEAIHRLVEMEDRASIPLFTGIVESVTEEPDLRAVAVRAIVDLDLEENWDLLNELVRSGDPHEKVLVEAIEGLGVAKKLEGRVSVKKHLHHTSPLVRSSAVENFAEITGPGAWISIVPLLKDKDRSVRRTVLRTLARLKVRDSIPAVIEAARDAEIRKEAMETLLAMPDRSALPTLLEGLLDKNPDVRELAGKALLEIQPKILPDLIERHRRKELSPELRRELGTLFAVPRPVEEWRIFGPWLKEKETVEFDVSQPANLDRVLRLGDRILEWRGYRGDKEYGRIFADKLFAPKDHVWIMAYTTIEAATAYDMHWKIGCDDQAILWINGEKVFESMDEKGWSEDDGEGKTRLHEGTNTIWLQSGNTGGKWVFSLAVSSCNPELSFLYEDVPEELGLEDYRQFALENPGNPKRGETLFMDRQGVGCIKCHAVGQEGDAIVGPNLLGVGTKFPKEELIRSVLEPSNRIESGYELTLIETYDEEFLDGIVRSETDREIELVNADGEILVIEKNDIRDRRKSTLSTMPSGLEKGMTLQDFADIIAYLESLRSETVSSQ